MRLLPALAHDRSRPVLPMADRSAAVLAELILADDPGQFTAAIAEQLVGDPPLLLWAVFVAAQRDGLRLRSVGEAAEWLCRRAGQVLQWGGQETPGPEPPDGMRLEALAGQAAADFALADLAAQAVPGLPEWLPVLAERLDRLRRLEEQFQATLETEKLQSMAEFAAGAGHEINNPLAIIAGRAQLLLKDETDPERRRELALINAQVRRAHEMIADLWLFARPPRPEPHSVDLVPLVDRVIEQFGPQAAERGVSLRRIGEAGPLPAEVDPVQLCVALSALCKNSVEAIGRDGHIEIGLRATDEGLQIRVSDSGPGITPEQRRHIFDPFYSARQAGRGLGMGLSKCWRIVTSHGGRIAVESEPGQGAGFVITLPRSAVRPASEP